MEEQDSTIERDAKGRPLPPPGVGPTSLRFALIVPAIAMAVVLLYILANLGTGGRDAKAVIPKVVAGAGLPASPASPFAPYVTNGEPPVDILSAVVIPTETSTPQALHNRGMPTSFDREIRFTTAASQATVYTFFRRQMVGRDWKIFSTGAPVGSDGVQILAQRGGSDSWFWIQGATISPTRFTADGSQETTVTLRLYQASAGA